MRKQLNLTLDQLSSLSNLSKTYLSKLENNRQLRPNPESLKKLAKQLDLNYNDLLIYTDYVERRQTAPVSVEKVDLLELLGDTRTSITIQNKR